MASAVQHDIRGYLGRHVPVGGVPVFDGGMREAVEGCIGAILSGLGARVATANLDFIALARRDTALRAALEQSHLVVADGAPVEWLARLSGAAACRRTAGVDLVPELLAEAARRGVALRVALYGATPHASEQAARRIEAESTAAHVVLRLTPPFRPLTPEEVAAERGAIAHARPDLVLVALGCPRQERLIAAYHDAAPGAVWIGVGGTLDFLAGRRWRAPGLVQGAGMEWLVRLAQEPRRLWRRYLLRDLPALVPLTLACARARLWPAR